MSVVDQVQKIKNWSVSRTLAAEAGSAPSGDTRPVRYGLIGLTRGDRDASTIDLTFLRSRCYVDCRALAPSETSEERLFFIN